MEVVCPKCGARVRVAGNKGVCRVCGLELWVCPYCRQVFTSQRGLAGHLKSHRRTGVEQVLTALANLAYLDKRSIIETYRALSRLAGDYRLDNRAIIELSLLTAALRRVSELEERIAKLESQQVGALRRAGELEERNSEKTGLPSFARDNPWLTVLASKR